MANDLTPQQRAELKRSEKRKGVPTFSAVRFSNENDKKLADSVFKSHGGTIFVAAIAFLHFRRIFMKDFLVFMAFFALGGVLLVELVGIIERRLSFVGHKAKIDSLRLDVRTIDIRFSRDIVLLASEYNQVIEANKAYRRVWWSRHFYPKGWELIDPIEMPK